MKKTIVLFAALMLLASSAFAAGKLSNITQEIDIENADIRASGGTGVNVSASGGGGTALAGGQGAVGVGVNTAAGSVVIGNIAAANGAEMDNVSQTIKAKGVKIDADGGSVSVGTISAQ